MDFGVHHHNQNLCKIKNVMESSMGKVRDKIGHLVPTDKQLEDTRNLIRDLIASGTLFALLSTGMRSCIPATSFADYAFIALFSISFGFVLIWSSLITDLNLRQITGSGSTHYSFPYFILATCFTVVFFGLTFLLLKHIW